MINTEVDQALEAESTVSPKFSLDDLPNIDIDNLQPIDIESLVAPNDSRHPPRILVLYGSVRARSFSRLAAEESSRLLRWYGCEVKMFDPSGLPLPDDVDADHPKVQELRELAQWSEGMLWVSPERHGSITSIMKAQSGGSQSFNTVNQMRILGRWMRMITIPNQSSIPKAFLEFNDDNRMDMSPLYLRLVDVCEELVKFTWLTRGRSDYLTDRYSERVESAEELSSRVNQKSI